MEMTGGEPDVIGMIKRQTNIFFTIAHRKVLKAAEAFVTIMRRWRQEKNINPKTALLRWLQIWALSF
jgi:hypothetical protein